MFAPSRKLHRACRSLTPLQSVGELRHRSRHIVILPASLPNTVAVANLVQARMFIQAVFVKSARPRGIIIRPTTGTSGVCLTSGADGIGSDAMAQFLGVLALVFLTVTLASTIITIWTERASAAQFLELTNSLLSWEVIAGGLAIGAVSTFYTEIKAV